MVPACFLPSTVCFTAVRVSQDFQHRNYRAFLAPRHGSASSWWWLLLPEWAGWDTPIDLCPHHTPV